MIKKFKLGKSALILSITTLITILAWIGFTVYRAATETTVTQATQQQILPLEPEIDRNIIEEAKNSLSFGEEELNVMPSPIIEEVVLLEATESGQIATESAGLE